MDHSLMPTDSTLQPKAGPRVPLENVRARVVTSLVFSVFGLVTGTWGARIPAIKEQTALSDGGLGLALLAAPLGVVIAMQVSGHIVHRFGSGPATRLTTLLVCITFPLPALAHSGHWLAVYLLVSGATWGMLDTSMNTHASVLEGRYGRPIMSSIHGCFSLGALVGAVTGGIAAHVHWSPLFHSAVASGAALLIVAPTFRWLLPAVVDAGKHNELADEPGDAVDAGGWSRPLLLLGAITLCSFLGEGAAYDWSAVHLHDKLDASPAVAALGVAAFSLSMCVFRFAGDNLIVRLGRVRLLRTGGLVAGVGLTTGLLFENVAIGLMGWTLFGAGLAAVAPITFAAAGNLPGVSRPKAISRVAGIGWIGVLLGPPLVGGIAELANLDVALGAAAMLALCIALLAPAAR